MKRRYLILAFIMSVVLSLITGILISLAASYLAPYWANSPWIIYVTLGLAFLVSLPLSIALFSHNLQSEQPKRTDKQTVHLPRVEKNMLPLQTRRRPQPKLFLVPGLPPQGVFGRKQDLKSLVELLAIKETDALHVPPVALRGMGGIGKTTLAISLAHLHVVSKHFVDGVLWTALGPRPSVRLHLDQWGRALGVDLLAEHDEQACQGRLRAALHDRQMLLIIDDVWDVHHARLLEIAGPHCRTLFTTREVPIAHDLATRDRTIRVDVLEAGPALALLRRLAPEAVSTNPPLASQLCQRLEFLPLGLTLAGRFLANEADVPERMGRVLAELVERRDARLHLIQSEGRLGLEEQHVVSLEAILGMSVERLGRIDQERFAMLALFGGEPLTWDLQNAAYVWDCSAVEAEDTVARLIQRGLVERRGARYWMHALLVDYAQQMMDEMKL